MYYKGLKKDLKCLNYQFKMGENHKIEGKIGLCFKGFHFCERLTDVFKYYAHNDSNIFCEVEPSGDIIKGGDKHCSNNLKIIRQLSEEEISKIVEKELAEKMDRIFCLDIIKKLQDKYNFMIGGSISLHIAGYTLDRESGKIDLDIIMPYYQKLEGDDELEIEEFDGKSSGNDYSQTYAISSKDGRFLKADVRICPQQVYDIQEYKGVKYKICDIMTTLEAKCRYAMEGNKKHKEDIMFLLNKRKI